MSKLKIYKLFEPKNINDKWCVVTQEDGIIVATVPQHIKLPKAVAIAIAKSLSEGRFALADPI